MTSVMISKKSLSSPWEYDSTNDRWYIEMGGERVIQVDSNGNIMAKGRLLKA